MDFNQALCEMNFMAKRKRGYQRVQIEIRVIGFLKKVCDFKDVGIRMKGN